MVIKFEKKRDINDEPLRIDSCPSQSQDLVEDSVMSLAIPVKKKLYELLSFFNFDLKFSTI